MKLDTWIGRQTMTLGRAAELFGVRRNTLYLWLHDGVMPTKPALLRIAEVTRGEVLPNDFLDFRDIPEKRVGDIHSLHLSYRDR